MYNLNINVSNTKDSLKLRTLTRDIAKHTKVSKPDGWENSKGGQKSKDVV